MEQISLEAEQAYIHYLQLALESVMDNYPVTVYELLLGQCCEEANELFEEEVFYLQKWACEGFKLGRSTVRNLHQKVVESILVNNEIGR